MLGCLCELSYNNNGSITKVWGTLRSPMNSLEAIIFLMGVWVLFEVKGQYITDDTVPLLERYQNSYNINRIDINFVQKWISPYDMLKQRVC